jgi:hypothetical protein
MKDDRRNAVSTMARPLLSLGAVFRDPLAQFLLVGAVLVTARRTTVGPRAPSVDEDGRRIVVDAAFADSVARDFERSAGRPLTDVQRARMIDDAVDEEILFREAKAMHLDEDDAIVRRRLVQKAEFLVDDLRPIPEPNSEDLQAYLAVHAESYRLPLQIDFRHVFFSRQHRGSKAEGDARAALERLERDPEARVQGDVFLAGDSFTERSPRDIDGLLGSGVGNAIGAQPPRRWSGPIASTYGFHLVFVERRREPGVPALEQVRAQVRQAVIDERREANRREARAALRARYVIDDRGGGWTERPVAHARNDVQR